MSNDTSTASGNPLSQFFRQPAIYVGLPSGGRFWADGCLDMPESGELPVYPMTSRDEITLRTPDALLNGQGVIDVIHSCVPNIKDAWSMPSSDVDHVLIAMRIASYGHHMDFDNKCPHCNEDNTYGLDLRQLMGSISFPDFDDPAEVNELIVKFQPQTFRQVNKANQISFEVNKLGQMIDALPDGDEKSQQVSMQMNRMIDLNYEMLANCTASIAIKGRGEPITNPEYILEFYRNIDSKLTNSIQEKLVELTKDANIKPMPVTCPNCQGDINLTILFDYANFFVVGS
jgi:hypothetical protein